MNPTVNGIISLSIWIVKCILPIGDKSPLTPVSAADMIPFKLSYPVNHTIQDRLHSNNKGGIIIAPLSYNRDFNHRFSRLRRVHGGANEAAAQQCSALLGWRHDALHSYITVYLFCTLRIHLCTPFSESLQINH